MGVDTAPVVIPEGAAAQRDRVSVPFFFQPSFGAVIETIPTTIDEFHPAHYEPVVAGEWICEVDGDAGLTCSSGRGDYPWHGCW